MFAGTRASNNIGGGVGGIEFDRWFKAPVLLRLLANTAFDEFDEADVFVRGGLEQLSSVTTRIVTSDACAHLERKKCHGNVENCDTGPRCV
jgi:hypothetical protein